LFESPQAIGGLLELLANVLHFCLLVDLLFARCSTERLLATTVGRNRLVQRRPGRHLSEPLGRLAVLIEERPLVHAAYLVLDVDRAPVLAVGGAVDQPPDAKLAGLLVVPPVALGLHRHVDPDRLQAGAEQGKLGLTRMVVVLLASALVLIAGVSLQPGEVA